nr:primosomal protein DnaI [Brevibacillus laterosporus]
MQSVGEALGSDDLKKRISLFDQAEKELKTHPVIADLLKNEHEHNHFSIGDLHQYLTEYNNCNKCPGLEKCPNTLRGYRLEPHANGGYGSQFRMSPCKLQQGYEMQQTIKKHVKSHCVPDHILNTTFEKLDKDQGRIHAIKRILTFCLNLDKGKTTRGLYIHGDFGVGKSAMAGAITQELAKRGVDVIMVYVPDYVSEVKAAIRTGEVEEKLKALKDVSVLILDDIGAEQLSSWVRDEIIGPILQSRMEKYPTIYTSNLTLDQLGMHLSQTKDETRPNVIKAKRLMDRIKPFVEVCEVKGRNRRHDNIV